jgi:hypothetical protein
MPTVPLSGTDIRLLSGIPFTNDYKHTRWFETITEQFNWFLSKPIVHEMPQNTFQRSDDGRSYVRVDKSIDELYGVNYMMFNNYKISRKWFYAFVTKLEYKNSNCTYVYFEIDVLQTWKFEMLIKPSYVVREHCPLWNTDGSPVVNTVDEGLHYGSEYITVSAENYRPCNGVYFMVACAKKGMHGTLNGSYYASKNGLPQLLVYYVHPFMLDGSSPSTNLGEVSSVADFLGALYTQTDAVNNIVSLYVTDCLPNNPSYSGGTLSFDSANYQNVSFSQQLNGSSINTIFVSDMDYGNWLYDDGNKYTGYTSPTESKLLMYPYTVLELTDLKGNKTTYKNEYINNSNLLIQIQSSLGTGNKVVYTIKDYLTNGLTDDTQKTKVSMETSLINNEPNDIPVLVDMLSAYLQGNRNSLQNQKNSIMFNGIMSAVSAGTGMIASGAMDNPMGVISSAEAGIRGAGNTALAIQGLQAKQQDINNTPPQLAKMGSNSYFDYGNGYTGLWIIKKEITPEYRKKLSDYFNMYGYKKNEVKDPNLHTRQNWNFVQTQDCVITGNFNVEDLNDLKSIFNNGITLWHTDDIGNYTLANGVI